MEGLLVGLPVSEPTHYRVMSGNACGLGETPPGHWMTVTQSMVTCPDCLHTLGMVPQDSAVPRDTPMQFTFHADGRVTVDRWDKVWVVSCDLLIQIARHVDSHRMRQNDVEIHTFRFPIDHPSFGAFEKGTVKIHIANGWAEYELKRERMDVHGFDAELKLGRLTDPKKSKGGFGYG